MNIRSIFVSKITRWKFNVCQVLYSANQIHCLTEADAATLFIVLFINTVGRNVTGACGASNKISDALICVYRVCQKRPHDRDGIRAPISITFHKIQHVGRKTQRFWLRDPPLGTSLIKFHPLEYLSLECLSWCCSPIPKHPSRGLRIWEAPG